MSAYTLYIGNKNYSSWSLRPWLLLRELGIDFAEVLLQFEADNHARFKAVAPNARVPCLHDGDAVVWDSLAIMEYLAERHPGVWPADAGARAWARSAAAEMHSGFAALRTVCPMNCGLRLRLHAPSAAMQADLARIDELWCGGLRRFGGAFLAGPAFGAVDAFYAPVAFRVQTYGLPLSPPAQDYAARLLALPGMQMWYEAALREPWREAAHERETLQQAELLADLRL